jgi:mycoredoxin-dependent peroxiredoxin
MRGFEANAGRSVDKRVLFLGLAAAIIGGLCAFKLARHYPPQHSIPARPAARPAPGVELYDQSSPSKIVRLESHLGRERVIVVFFDGAAGAHVSPILIYLRDNWNRLRDANIRVLAISAALPQENRKDIAQHEAFPFPLLSDPDFHVHREWGRFEPEKSKPLFGLFLVDRKGWVAWSEASGKPLVSQDWKSAVEEQIRSHEL